METGSNNGNENNKNLIMMIIIGQKVQTGREHLISAHMVMLSLQHLIPPLMMTNPKTPHMFPILILIIILIII